MTRTILCCCVLLLFVTGIAAVAQERRLGDRLRAVFGTSSTDQNRMNVDARELTEMLNTYQAEALELFINSAAAEWEAMTTGADESFKRTADAKLQYATYHSSKEVYEKIKDLRPKAVGLDPVSARAAERMEKAYAQNQLPEELQKKMLDMSAEIEMIFQKFRPTLDGKEYSNNDLLEMIAAETDSAKRKAIWEALKQVGEEVNVKIIALAKVRNEAAKQLGFKNYWEMNVTFQDYKPNELLRIFDELEIMTRPLFATMKAELDSELAAKFGVPVDQLKPWHYDNPFFQQAPPSKEVNPNDFYRDKTKEEIVDIAVRYFRRVGLPYDKVLEKSDMYEREGKNQHAFSIDMDTLGDVRNLNNVKPTAEWMDTVLHEGGHGVYSLGHDAALPFNLRDPAHIFATEGVAMLFGAKARDPEWMIAFAGVDPREARRVAQALKNQRIREQLIFCRWAIVMLNFEKALYENPDADLKPLWWDMVGEYQLLSRPTDRGSELADWASKPHFVIAPVYYHNYQMGELFAAQLRATMLINRENPLVGRQLQTRVFAPGQRYEWQEFVRRATGKPLSPEYFARELR
ncbi:MAG: M2 family metallopeptidase [Planctomycetaceae bacterium]|nr:M2 family metallopeptidase [Planctomycetaceae bacterium]